MQWKHTLVFIVTALALCRCDSDHEPVNQRRMRAGGGHAYDPAGPRNGDATAGSEMEDLAYGGDLPTNFDGDHNATEGGRSGVSSGTNQDGGGDTVPNNGGGLGTAGTKADGSDGEPVGNGSDGEPVGNGSDGEPVGNGSDGEPVGNGSDGTGSGSGVGQTTQDPAPDAGRTVIPVRIIAYQEALDGATAIKDGAFGDISGYSAICGTAGFNSQYMTPCMSGALVAYAEAKLRETNLPFNLAVTEFVAATHQEIGLFSGTRAAVNALTQAKHLTKPGFINLFFIPNNDQGWGSTNSSFNLNNPNFHTNIVLAIGRQTLGQAGHTLAHELGHVFGLGGHLGQGAQTFTFKRCEFADGNELVFVPFPQLGAERSCSFNNFLGYYGPGNCGEASYLTTPYATAITKVFRCWLQENGLPTQ